MEVGALLVKVTSIGAHPFTSEAEKSILLIPACIVSKLYNVSQPLLSVIARVGK